MTYDSKRGRWALSDDVGLVQTPQNFYNGHEYIPDAMDGNMRAAPLLSLAPPPPSPQSASCNAAQLAQCLPPSGFRAGGAPAGTN